MISLTKRQQIAINNPCSYPEEPAYNFQKYGYSKLIGKHHVSLMLTFNTYEIDYFEGPFWAASVCFWKGISRISVHSWNDAMRDIAVKEAKRLLTGVGDESTDHLDYTGTILYATRGCGSNFKQVLKQIDDLETMRKVELFARSIKNIFNHLN